MSAANDPLASIAYGLLRRTKVMDSSEVMVNIDLRVVSQCHLRVDTHVLLVIPD